MHGTNRLSACRTAIAVAGLAVVMSGSLPTLAAPTTPQTGSERIAQASPPAAPAPAQEAARDSGPASRVEVRISDLQRKLHITPAQQPAFDAFAAVMRTNAQSMQQVFEERASADIAFRDAGGMQRGWNLAYKLPGDRSGARAIAAGPHIRGAAKKAG